MAVFLCGIDGGGTTTSVVVCDEQGEVQFQFQAESINHYGIGLEKARENYSHIKDQLVKRLGRQPDMTYIGSSALDGEADAKTTHLLVGDIFTNKVIIHSDVYIALLGLTQGDSGALLISGTGSMACAVDDAGNYFTCGGWGQILGDEGSGYHLGLMGIQAALRAYDQIAPPTILTERLTAFYGLSKLTDLIELVYNPPIEKSRIAAFAIEVEHAALQEDKVALDLLNNEIDWLYRLSQAILQKSKVKLLGLYGSMLVKSPVIGQQLMAKFTGSDIKVLYPCFTPEIGALFGAFKIQNIPIDEKIIKNLSKYH